MCGQEEVGGAGLRCGSAADKYACLFVRCTSLVAAASALHGWRLFEILFEILSLVVPLSEDNCLLSVASFLKVFKQAYVRGCACCMALPHQ